MDLYNRKAVLSDTDLLAQMNKHLIEDEGSRNPMNISQLMERMKNILSGEWKAVIISKDSEDIDYLIYKVSPDKYFPDQTELHIRQYFIKRQHRGNGLGTYAFDIISKEYFPNDAVLTLDVLEINPKGRKFWEKIGSKPYLTHMKKT